MGKRARTPLGRTALLWLACICAVLLAGCAREQSRQARPGHRPTTVFTHDMLLRTTPVRDQGNSSFCWIYAMLGTIETEHLMRGDSVCLSTAYLSRMYLQEQGRRCQLSGGRTPLSQRATAATALRLLADYGVVAHDAYDRRPEVNYTVLTRKLQRTAQVARRLSDFNRQADALLDEALGFMPRYVFMYGAEYTAQEFARSVCRSDEYRALTSFTHHPFGQEAVLELPDNQEAARFLNLPLDTLMQALDRALRQGHPVCWEGDISEPGFSFARGTATLPHSHPCTQEERQQAFDRHQTTDDHCLVIIGTAHDRQGQRYYVAKNSWGTRNPYGGLMYLSADYVRLKTIALFVPGED